MNKINIKEFIDLLDIKMAVDSVTELVFDDNGDYMPYIKSFAIDYATLMFFTDFPTNKIYESMFKNENGNFNLQEFYRFLNTNEEVHDVLIQMTFSQYKDFLTAVEENIKYKLNLKYHSNKILEVLALFDNLIENKEFSENIIKTAVDSVKEKLEEKNE